MEVVINIDTQSYKEIKKDAEIFRNRKIKVPQLYQIIDDGIPIKNYRQLKNSEWIDLLVRQFNISRTSAKDMLHVMMKVKKEDNFKKLFNSKKENEQ